MTGKALQTVVFVGPSCPVEPIRAILPQALIVPPARRGDLYRYRILGFSVFVVLDGVFANTLAISPREVVDVIEDGAAIFGAASMGALRAADCAPAGAIGHGAIYRLFRCRAISSEDEVAVSFLPDRPWPALSEPLVGIRLGARRAVRCDVLGQAEAQALVIAAEGMAFPDRTWAGIARAAGVELSTGQLAFLKRQVAKKSDALGCCRLVARRLRWGTVCAAPRKDARAGLGQLGRTRERGAEPYPCGDIKALWPDFLKWLWITGRFDLLVGSEDRPAAASLRCPESLTFELGALALRFAAFRMAVARARRAHLRPTPADLRRAERELARAHGAGNWSDLMKRYGAWPDIGACLIRHRTARALSFACAREEADGTSDRETLPYPGIAARPSRAAAE
ncbi:TfuA-like protein [Jhaorihella thermophila]|uniref:TfuA-like core domain-containing protein n=1 Tax=Jhaorihella thermophila TaxID=488547 RepID=A0A1H5UM57_9RHOB|nr:TfuA-like protein [Jhaorihella thermophila]SEF75481.1 hypothetical protein SAMN05421751_104119 [Jhaorihella thermophila]